MLFEKDASSPLFIEDKTLEDDIFSSSTSTKSKITPKSDPVMGTDDLFSSDKTVLKSDKKNDILATKNTNKDPLLGKSDNLFDERSSESENLFNKVEKPKKNFVVPDSKKLDMEKNSK